jgi:hypothetical protein
LCRVVLKTGCDINFHQESNNGTLLCARCVIFDDTTKLSDTLQSGNHQGACNQFTLVSFYFGHQQVSANLQTQLEC